MNCGRLWSSAVRRPPQGALRLRRLERKRNCGTAAPVGHEVADWGPPKILPSPNNSPDTLQALKKLPDFYHFLNSNTDIVPLANNDLAIIQHFLGLGPRIGPSLVRFDQNNRIVVIEGPLKGIEGNIIKVDRRKHRAKIKVDFHGSTYSMDLSFEDIERK